VTFTDLLLQQGVFLQVIQMASIMQGPLSQVAGWTDPGFEEAPLSWAQIQATNSTFTRSAPTFDGLYEGVGALFLPQGTYSITFSDVQYQSQTGTQQPILTNFAVQWGGSYSLTPQPPLCPTGSTCGT
jgi:hypothetical protein